MELSAIPQSLFALTKGKTESCDDRKPFGSETTANCLLLGLRHDISNGRNEAKAAVNYAILGRLPFVKTPVPVSTSRPHRLFREMRTKGALVCSHFYAGFLSRI
ncbi:hypothetical protein [Acetobacter sp. DmW_043]|uniref:hypothetical protein n=1 Tax=Acetobacter sp. DmW_043 TaxID=1670658 RepID=UPI001177BB16|nr:hypothetical protein [Acetobacter sp. DmW_043]